MCDIKYIYIWVQNLISHSITMTYQGHVAISITKTSKVEGNFLFAYITFTSSFILETSHSKLWEHNWIMWMFDYNHTNSHRVVNKSLSEKECWFHVNINGMVTTRGAPPETTVMTTEETSQLTKNIQEMHNTAISIFNIAITLITIY